VRHVVPWKASMPMIGAHRDSLLIVTPVSRLDLGRKGGQLGVLQALHSGYMSALPCMLALVEHQPYSIRTLFTTPAEADAMWAIVQSITVEVAQHCTLRYNMDTNPQGACTLGSQGFSRSAAAVGRRCGRFSSAWRTKSAHICERIWPNEVEERQMYIKA
jgi:hypothetical protein